MSSKLLDKTIELLDTTLIPMARVARVVECSTRQLSNIRERKSVPNVVLCERIYNLLSRSDLEVK